MRGNRMCLDCSFAGSTRDNISSQQPPRVRRYWLKPSWQKYWLDRRFITSASVTPDLSIYLTCNCSFFDAQKCIFHYFFALFWRGNLVIEPLKHPGGFLRGCALRSKLTRCQQITPNAHSMTSQKRILVGVSYPQLPENFKGLLQIQYNLWICAARQVLNSFHLSIELTRAGTKCGFRKKSFSGTNSA